MQDLSAVTVSLCHLFQIGTAKFSASGKMHGTAIATTDEFNQYQ
jgi:hypothetical protein